MMVAGRNPATRLDRRGRGKLLRRPIWAGRSMASRGGVPAVAAAMLALAQPAQAANTVQITKLTDVTIGTIANVGADTVQSQNVCIFSGTSTKGYHVLARGSGSSNAFTLASGGRSLAYEVQWAPTSGATSGTNLTSNVNLTGLTTTATNATCSSSPFTTATLFVIIRSAAASSATAGTYNGTLTLVFGFE